MALWAGLCPLPGQAGLPEWVRFVQGGSALQEVFFRPVALPPGAKLARRPPRETREALTRLIANLPQQADLYALRAREAERALDFADAEGDWKAFASLAADPIEGQLALADFYHRRLLPQQEAEALLAVGRSTTPEAERFLPFNEHRSWKALERIFNLFEAHPLPLSTLLEAYQAWRERYPNEPSIPQKVFYFLMERKWFGEARQLLSDYEQRFPEDRAFSVKARAEIFRRTDSEEEALAFYESAFDPLWPPPLIRDYFATVKQQRSLLDLLGRARTELEEDPQNLKAAAKLFYYYQYHGNTAAAEEVLFEVRLHKKLLGASWNAGELSALAKLFADAGNPAAAACHYYQIHILPAAALGEEALAGLIELLSVQEQPFQAGPGDESSECDLPEAAAGLWSDIRSFLTAADGQRESSLLARLTERFDRQFPKSAKRAELHAKVLGAYAAYGDHDRVISAGRRFLEEFEQPSTWRTEAGLLMAAAYAAKDEWQGETAVYDSLLRELAAEAGGVPLGSGVVAALPRDPGEGPRPPGDARSPGYARVLGRYVSRLIALGRTEEAISVYAREIDRNANDQGLYDRFADFLSENGLDAALETLYRRATSQFPDPYWRHKLARWYLRQQNHAEFERLTRETIENLTGPEIEEYFEEIVEQSALEPAVDPRIYLAARERFPFSIALVRNLVDAYERERTRDEAAREELLRQYWFYDEELRDRFFELLSNTRRLDQEREQVRAAWFAATAGNWQQLVRENPAAGQFLAETEIVRSRFEPAVPLLLALVNDFPADETLLHRAASVCRTLALANPLYVHLVAGIEEGLLEAQPRSRDLLVRLGDLWADLQEFERAKAYWERIAALEPGRPEGYIEAAAAFENYGLLDDALRLLETGSRRLAGNPALFAYESGSLHEKKGDVPAAVTQYLQGALADQGDSPSRARLAALSALPAHRDLIEQAVVQLTAGRNPAPAAVELRAAVLEAQGRRDELARFLLQLIANTTSLDLLTTVGRIGSRHGVDAARIRLVERQIELTDDPARGARLQLLLLGLIENGNDIAALERVKEAIYREHSALADAVRDVADAAWEEGNSGRALEILSEAAEQSYPQLDKQSTLAAAREAMELGGYEHARLLLETLLAEEPFRAEYLEAMADTYIAEGLFEPLRDFYQRKIEALGSASLLAAEKAEVAMALRRGLISTLTVLDDHAAAVAQYAGMIGEHPDDHGLVAEAARYAAAHGRRDQLLASYGEVAEAAPGSRRRMLLWRLQAHFEDLSAPRPSSGRFAEGRFQRLASLEPDVSLENLLEEARSSYQPRNDPPEIAESPAAPTVTPPPVTPPPAIPPVAPSSAATPPAAPRAAAPPASPPSPASAPGPSVESAGPASPAVRFFVQTGAFKEKDNAVRLLGRLQEEGYPARKSCGENFSKVLVGPYDSRPVAVQTENRLSLEGYDTWVRRLAYRESVEDHALASPLGPQGNEEARFSTRCIEAMSYKPLGRP